MFEFSDEMRTLKVYHYDEETYEYLTSSIEQIPPHTGLPACSTIVKPKMQKGRWPVFNPETGKWSQVVDHVGKKVWNIYDGLYYIVDRVGPIPKGYTLKPRPDFTVWNGKDWEYSEELYKSFIVNGNTEYKNHLTNIINRKMKIYEDMVELGVITDKEKEEYRKLKMDRILLHRIDLNSEINTWPELEGE